ncbi:MAG TPA: sigma-70 family RNA polymerase sigma factor [Pseudonocardiaceae bacterium]|nr:sigma-70 family RNA polymerase sigma factor [Pseudonocardiaceae bacterium]
MEQQDWLAERFEAHRTHLRTVAYRMLGSPSEADDAVQEAWLRLSRSGSDGVVNLGGWLTTIVARVCLNMLSSRALRREEPLEVQTSEPGESYEDDNEPEHQALLADSVGSALLVVLDTLTPAERLAFVLHDVFAMPFNEIAVIVERSPAAARQLASRARRRVQSATAAEVDHTRQREVVEAFLAASRTGDFDALLAVLDPDVVLRADRLAVQAAAASQAQGAPTLASEVRGAAAVAEAFSGRAQAAQPALINGAAGAVWAPGGRPRVAFAMTVTGSKIVAIDILMDPGHLRQLNLVIIND